MLRYGLKKDELSKIVKAILANPKVDEIILFGSRARSNATEDNDIDLAVKGKNLIPSDLEATYSALVALGMPYAYDLVIYDDVQEESLKAHIDQIGVLLHRRNHDVIVV